MRLRSKDRRPSAPKSPLGRVGRWTLTSLILCLALIGLLHLTRGTAVRHVRGVGADGVPIGVSEPQFPLVVTMMTGAWLAAGNHVEVTLNGDGTYERLWDRPALGAAVDHAAVVLRGSGADGGNAPAILLERAKAGVRVFVLYDAFGAVDIPEQHRDALRAAGVVVEPFRPIRLVHTPPRAEPLARARHCHRRPYRMDGRLRHRRQMVWRRPHQRRVAGNQRAIRGTGGPATPGRVRGRLGEATGVTVHRARDAGAAGERRDRGCVVVHLTDAWQHRRPSASSHCRSLAPASGCTSPTRTSHRTAASSTCWLQRPDVAWMCAS